MENYVVEKLSEKNIEHLISLYLAANHKAVSREFLLKKYHTKFWGAEYIGYIAYTGKMPVAFYGVIPSIINLNGKSILTAQSADTMTHPDFQRKGLFVELASHTFKLAKESGIHFIYGFASPNSLPGTIKLGFEILPVGLQLFKFRTNVPPFVGRLSRLYGLKNFIHWRTRSILNAKPFPPLEIFNGGASYGLEHDQLFIDYKSYNEKFFVRLEDILLWVKIDGNQLKVGLVNYKNGTPQLFLKKISDLAVKLWCTEIIFITTKGSALYSILSTLTMPADVFPICFKNLSGEAVEFQKIEFEYADADFF